MLLSSEIIQQQNCHEEPEGVFRSVITDFAALEHTSFGLVGVIPMHRPESGKFLLEISNTTYYY